MELAAPKTPDTYEWRVYRAARGTNLTTTNRKHSVMLREGVRFGLRPASRGNAMRLITEELGPNTVFTLSVDDANRLQKKSAAAKGTKPKSKATAADAIPQPARTRAETTAQRANAAAAKTRAALVEAFAGLTAVQSRSYLTWLVDNAERPSAATLARWKRSAQR